MTLYQAENRYHNLLLEYHGKKIKLSGHNYKIAAHTWKGSNGQTYIQASFEPIGAWACAPENRTQDGQLLMFDAVTSIETGLEAYEILIRRAANKRMRARIAS